MQGDGEEAVVEPFFAVEELMSPTVADKSMGEQLSKLNPCSGIAEGTAESSTHGSRAIHLEQYLCQVRERHWLLSQVLRSGVVHDPEQRRRTRSAVDLARPVVAKDVAAEHNGDLHLPCALHCCSRSSVPDVAHVR